MSLVGFKQSIYSKISAVSTRAYAGKAPENATFPYVTYRLDRVDPIDARRDYYLDIDVWDDDENTTAIENLTESIITSLNYNWYEDSKCFWHSYLTEHREIDDPDERIHRRNLEFVIKARI